MAKKRSQPRTSRTRAKSVEHNGFDHGDAHDEAERAGAVDHLDTHEEPGGLPALGDGILAVDGFLSRMVYTASYSVSFGIVFPVMLLARSVPAGNALVRGLKDGGHAARRAVGAIYDDSPLPEPQEPAQVSAAAHA